MNQDPNTATTPDRHDDGRGTTTATRGDWIHRAACRGRWDAWCVDHPSRGVRAAHVCQVHCPVRPPCLAGAWANPPVGVVQGGVYWAGSGDQDGRPVELATLTCAEARCASLLPKPPSTTPRPQSKRRAS